MFDTELKREEEQEGFRLEGEEGDGGDGVDEVERCDNEEENERKTSRLNGGTTGEDYVFESVSGGDCEDEDAQNATTKLREEP